MNQGLTKSDRLLKPPEFRLARRQGTRRRTAHFVFSFLGRTRGLKLGISVGRPAGTAVERNRIKRTIREFFRLNRHALGFSGDVVVLALPGCGRVKRPELEEELKRGFAMEPGGARE